MAQGERITIGIPKGSLETSTLELFAKAGFRFFGSERSFWLESSDAELRPVLLRPQEIPIYVANGSLDCGLAGWDWIVENECRDNVTVLADLCYSKRSFRPVKWVLAVADKSVMGSVDDLRQIKTPIRISTELRAVTENWLSERGIIADVRFSWGATEAKVPYFADAIVDCTETGATLRSNGLRIIDTILESTTRFFANKQLCRRDERKKSKLEGIALLLKSCLNAETKVSIRASVPEAGVTDAKLALGASATFSTWVDESGVSVFEIVVERDVARDMVPRLARIGARKIAVTTIGMLYE